MNFDNLTIGQMQKLTEEFKRNNPEVKTPQELMEDLK